VTFATKPESVNKAKSGSPDRSDVYLVQANSEGIDMGSTGAPISRVP